MGDRRRWGLVIGVTGVAAALRLYRLGAPSLWVDELITLELVRRYGTIELVTAIPTVQPHLPLYYVLLDLWIGLAGTTPAAMRLLAVGAGLLAVPAIYLLGRDMYDSTTGLLAAVFVALSRLHISHSQQVRMYTVLVLLTIVSYYLFYSRDRRYVPASLALVVTHPFGVLPVLSQLIAAVLPAEHRLRTSRRSLGLMSMTLVPLLGGLLVMAGGRTNPWMGPPGIEAILSVPVQFFVRGGLFNRLAVPGLVVGVVAAVTQRAPTSAPLPLTPARSPETRLLVTGVALPFGLLIGVSYLVTPVFTARYAFVAAPPLYLLVSRGLSRLRPRSLRALLLALLLVSMSIAVVDYHRNPQREQWKEATAVIESQADTDALVLVYDRIATRNVRYYLDRPLQISSVVAADSGTGRDPTPPATVQRRVTQHTEVWVVFTHVSPQQQRQLTAVVGRTHQRTACHEFVEVRVCRFEQRASMPDTS